ncbi:MAG: outer membrane protein assembly factor BamD [Candidatus Longimicrobiales bacterium M2_2A_002]
MISGRKSGRLYPTVTGLLAVCLLAGASACASNGPELGQLEPETLWERGVTAFNAEEWEDAVRYFDRFVLTGGSDPRVIQARYYIGRAHFENEEYITAAAEFSRLAADLGRAELADDARFMACRAYEELSPDPELDQEYTRAALDHCQALVEYFPESEYTGRANAIADRMTGKLAEKGYGSGDWYFRRRAYDSALIYFEDVVERYPGTQWAPRALLKQYEIYTRLQYDEEREEVRQRLLSEYPDSEAAESVRTG